MSEPVAWIHNNLDIGAFRIEWTGEPPKGRAALYSADVIERKDAAIAELVGVLKECAESLGRFISQYEWAQEDMNTADSVDYFIAKYDKSKDGL